MNGQAINISVTTATIGKVILMLFGAWVLFQLFDIALVILTAIVIASALEPMTQWFMKRKLPRVLSVLTVYLLFLGSFFGVMYIFVPLFLFQASVFLASLPTYFEFLQHLPGQYSPILQAAGADPLASVVSLVDTLKGVLQDFTGDSFGTVSKVFGGVLSFVLIFVFSFYFSMQEKGIENFLRIIVPTEHETYVLDLWRRSQIKIGRWLQGQLLLGVVVGVLVFLSLTIIGIPHAFVLAVIAAIFELIPVFGPTLSALPAVMVAFVYGGVTMGLIVIALYVIIQQFENHLIYPLVVTKVVGVPPLLVILSIIIGAKLAGFLGILLSAPIAAVVQEVISDIEARRRARAEAQRSSAVL